MADRVQLANALVDSGQQFAPTALAMPRELINESVKWMDEIKPLRGKYTRGTYKAGGHYKPLKPDWNPDQPGNFVARTLETFACQVEEEFDPASMLTTVYSKPLESIDHIGMDIVKLIAVEEMRKASEDLNECIWQGVRNESSTDSLANFDGFGTIIRKELTAGNIGINKGNYKQTGGINKFNVGPKLKAIWKKRNRKIKSGEMYVEQEILDMYNEWYQAQNFNNANTNTDGQQQYLIGSNKKCKLVSCPGMEGMGFIIVTDGKRNLMFGSHGIGVGEDAVAPFILRHGNNVKSVQLYTEAWFGVQFSHIEKEFLMVSSYRLVDTDTDLTVDNEEIEFDDTEIGETDTATLTLKGQNLTSSVTVTCDGAFTANVDTITADDLNADDGKTITITFTPTEAGDTTGTIRFVSATDDINLPVSLKGKGVESDD